jgi:hypothetical protein
MLYWREPAIVVRPIDVKHATPADVPCEAVPQVPDDASYRLTTCRFGRETWPASLPTSYVERLTWKDACNEQTCEFLADALHGR